MLEEASGVMRQSKRSQSIVNSTGPVNYGNMPQSVLQQRASIVNSHRSGAASNAPSKRSTSIVSSNKDGLPFLDLTKGPFGPRTTPRQSGPISQRGAMSHRGRGALLSQRGSMSQRGQSVQLSKRGGPSSQRSSGAGGTLRSQRSLVNSLPASQGSQGQQSQSSHTSSQFVGITGRQSPGGRTQDTRPSLESEALSYIDQEELDRSNPSVGSQDEQIAMQSSKSSGAMSQGEVRAAARAYSVKRDSMQSEVIKPPSLFSNQRLSEDISPNHLPRSSLTSSAAPYMPRGGGPSRQSHGAGRFSRGARSNSRATSGIGSRRSMTDSAKKSFESIRDTATRALDELSSSQESQLSRRSMPMDRKRSKTEERQRSNADNGNMMGGMQDENFNARANFDLSGIVDLQFDMVVSKEEQKRILQKITQNKSGENELHIRVQPEIDLILTDVIADKQENGVSNLRCSMRGEVDLEIHEDDIGFEEVQKQQPLARSTQQYSRDHITEEPEDQSQFGHSQLMSKNSRPGLGQSVGVVQENEGDSLSDGASFSPDTLTKTGESGKKEKASSRGADLDRDPQHNDSIFKNRDTIGPSIMPSKISENPSADSEAAEKAITKLNYDYNVPEIEHESYLQDENRVEVDSEARKQSLQKQRGTPRPNSDMESFADEDDKENKEGKGISEDERCSWKHFQIYSYTK